MPYKNAKPICWKNWHLKLSGTDSFGAVEVPLYSDAWIIGGENTYGPYTIINPVPMCDMNNRYEWKPAIVLRADFFIDSQTRDMTKTDEKHYHGGWLYDEIAALLSLVNGIRVEAGPVQREFYHHGDPLGLPRTYSQSQLPSVVPSVNAPVIPSLFRNCNLDKSELISEFSQLTQLEAMDLVKSARMYQKALYVSDASPEMSWILFVSALENAAGHWRSKETNDLDQLKLSNSKLVNILTEYDDTGELCDRVAKLLAPMRGSTSKFINFCLNFLPGAPQHRPSYSLINFNKETFKPLLSIIYTYRSKALHGGIPFPDPMCYPPRKTENGVHNERPDGLAVSTKDAVWMAADLPMHLHVFEYITRGVLLNWWSSMLSDHRE